jgi:uncharacterized protein (TIGR03437 family)
MELLQTVDPQVSARGHEVSRFRGSASLVIRRRVLTGALALLIYVTPSQAQQSILNTNLVVNGNAEAGSAGTGVTTAVASIPGWTVTSGKPTVLPYNLTSTAAAQPTHGYEQLTDPAPQDHGFQYFAAVFPSTPAVISQAIDVSSASSLINASNAEFIASAYMGSAGGLSVGTQMDVAFQNSSGQTFSTTTLGPAFPSFPVAGMFLYQQIGIVPAGTVRIMVSLTLQDANYDTGIADSLSLILTQAGSSPALGKNLVVNPGAEIGPSAALPADTLYVPGWSTSRVAGSVCPYGGMGFISTQAPGPADRGTNLFCGWNDSVDLYQDIDVSAAATAIDSGQVTYVVSGWLGGSSNPTAATLTYLFFDWSGKQLAPTAQLSPASFSGYSLVETESTGALPMGTRRVRIDLNFRSLDSLADDIGFALSAPGAPPVFTPGGIVSASAFGGFTTVAPGSWIEIYGDNLFAGSPQQWALSQFNNGVAPTSVGGVSVSVGGTAAFIDFVSANQVNALIPSNAPVGATSIKLTNANGSSDNYPIYVNATQPGVLAPSSFIVGGKQYIGAVFSDGQTFALPANAIPGVPSRPAQPGDTLTIYGVGFGPVTGGFTAGTIVTAANSLVTPVQFSFGNTQVTPSYSGLAPSFTGLYQFNVTVPAGLTANNAEPISFSQGGVKSAQTLYIAIQ